MSVEQTIVLELTPIEAAILCEMMSIYDWNTGPWDHVVRQMYFELDKEIPDRVICKTPYTVSAIGEVPPGAIWLEDPK